MTLLHILSYVGIIAGFAFVVLSLASGLLWISEVIEEHSRLAKVVGVRAIYTIIALQLLLYFMDSLPLGHTLFAIACNAVYLQNFSSSWPLISLTSPSFIASCVLSIANHFLWFFYFSRRSQNARHKSHRRYGAPLEASHTPGFADIATFFAVCVWLVPMFLFLSLSANDHTLPVSSGAGQISPTSTPATPVTTSRSSLFKSIIDIFPRVRRRNATEGIILSHTPNPSAPSTPYASSFGQSAYSSGMPSSPVPPLQSFSTSDSALLSSVGESRRASLQLRPPPKRNSTGPAQRVRGSDSASRRSLEDPKSTLDPYGLRVPSPNEGPSPVIRRRPMQD
ncbi:DUF396-domain-containing protein [Schizopora paradoxa]|uniref:DUF396-domain-containing protein n=1 Tax=Schizopora paradoxa TaxID=27342 RepID=A0A0H2S6K0_9AGAM|nr:DUF396-domain-containing protein [Schizopora paradoxa]